MKIRHANRILSVTDALLIATSLLAASLLGFVTPLFAEDSPTDAWRGIAPFFSPPKQFVNDFGDYRSPLRFADGRPVRSADGWKKRRSELLKKWQDLLGHWPPLMTDPKVEVLESTRRENFQQLRIRFKWTPDEFTTGYLLIPDGDAPKPAVVTVYYEPETAIGLKAPNRDFAYQLARRGFVALSLGTTSATRAKTFSLYYPSIEKAAGAAAFDAGLCGRQCVVCVGQPAGSRREANRHRRTFLRWKVGDVRFLPVRQVCLRGLVRSGNRFRPRAWQCQLLGTVVSGLPSASVAKAGFDHQRQSRPRALSETG